MARPSKSQTLAKVHAGNRAPADKTTRNPLVEPSMAVAAEDGLTDFDVHNGILDRLGFDRLLGSATECVMEARLASGAQKSTLIKRAIAYLQRADLQLVANAILIPLVVLGAFGLITYSALVIS